MDAPPGLEDLRFLFGDEQVTDLLDEECWEYDDNQLFDEHDSLHRRLGKSLYYGGNDSTSEDGFSFPLTQLCVEHFNRVITTSSLDMAKASGVARDTCSSPTSLVVALLYLERLRGSNPGYLSTVSSADLFLVSLMVASKYLHDDGEEDEVFNDEWATSGGMTKRQLNDLEMEFLISLDWRLHVTPVEFEDMASNLERAVAKKQITARKWNGLTYTDLQVLSKPLVWSANVWDTFLGLTLKVTTVVVAAYAASLVSMLATCHVLNQAKLGPSAISQSVSTLYNSALNPAATNRSSTTVVVVTPTNVSRRGSGDPDDDIIMMNESDPRFCAMESCQNQPSSPDIPPTAAECQRRQQNYLDPIWKEQRWATVKAQILSDFGLELDGFPPDPDKKERFPSRPSLIQTFAEGSPNIVTVVH